MIFNCDSCGKSISSKKDLCPYCKTETLEFSLILESKQKIGIRNLPLTFKEKLKGTLASIRF